MSNEREERLRQARVAAITERKAQQALQEKKVTPTPTPLEELKEEKKTAEAEAKTAREGQASAESKQQSNISEQSSKVLLHPGLILSGIASAVGLALAASGRIRADLKVAKLTKKVEAQEEAVKTQEAEKKPGEKDKLEAGQKKDESPAPQGKSELPTFATEAAAGQKAEKAAAEAAARGEAGVPNTPIPVPGGPGS